MFQFLMTLGLKVMYFGNMNIEIMLIEHLNYVDLIMQFFCMFGN